ncbi:hypothetical protein EC957_003931 [Mortierella hygrophila]|uniref:Uncharacterized protein n=1 Tax=Mortierella hygrophila TaxID=979708 RepID=A0A9P6F2W6_9FUNG|nr:hypothetical protein EC957_003931 [Mortierella hygrophila]
MEVRHRTVKFEFLTTIVSVNVMPWLTAISTASQGVYIHRTVKFEFLTTIVSVNVVPLPTAISTASQGVYVHRVVQFEFLTTITAIDIMSSSTTIRCRIATLESSLRVNIGKTTVTKD